MNEFREAIARLNLSLKNDLLNNPPVFDMPQISKIEEKLQKLVDGDIGSTLPEDVTEKLITKLISGAGKFTHREIRDLPFVIYDSRIDKQMTANIIKYIDISKERYFKRLLYVYFLNYDSSYKTKFLSQVILLTFKKHISQKFNSDIINKLAASQSLLFV